MPRAGLDQQLRALQDEVLFLGTMVEKALERAMDALVRRDLEASRRVVQEDDYIDRKRFEIEEHAIDLIATQQPMARDLRTLIALLHITVELERMGDYAEGIGKISLMMGERPPVKPLEDIPRMAEKAREMLRQALDALVHRDLVQAYAVCNADDVVDRLHDTVYHDLIQVMIRDPSTIQDATYLIWVAHNLERVADRATNIAERVIYLVTGRLVEVNVSKY